MDVAHKETDAVLTKIEKRLRKEYKQATKEIEKKLDDYFAAFRRKDENKRRLVKDGTITQKEYNDWRYGQMCVGKRWEDMRDKLATELSRVDAIARNISDGYMPEVYAINHNFATYQIETGAKINTSYTLYDAQSVERLVRDNPQILPRIGRTTQELIDKGILKKWNMKNIQSTMMQGILQGESITKLAKRIAADVGAMNYKDCVRHARTMTTATQNAGRVDGFKRAKGMGIDIMQEWVATLDMRTRHAHRQLDGQRRPVGEPFEVDGYELQYPADPAAPYYLTMNCRCTLIGQIKGFERDARAYRHDPAIDGMTYDEWKNGKPTATKTIKAGQDFESKLLQAVLGDDYEPFIALVNDSPNKVLYDKYIDECKGGINRVKNGGVYRSAFDEIEFDYVDREGMNRYETLAHESGHLFDHHIGRYAGLSFSEIDMINERCKIGSGSILPFAVRPSASDQFLEALRKDMEAIRPRLAEVCAEFKETTAKRNATSGIQDALDGFFGTQKIGLTGWGHGNTYYNGRYNKMIKTFGNEQAMKQAYIDMGYDVKSLRDTKNMARQYTAASEAWANVSSAVTVGGDELKYMEQYMPETVKIYKEIIGKVV